MHSLLKRADARESAVIIYLTCRGWPKNISHYQMIKNRIKSVR